MEWLSEPVPLWWVYVGVVAATVATRLWEDLKRRRNTRRKS